MPTVTRKRTIKNSDKKEFSDLKIIPLGGLGEIGKNLTAIQYGEDIIVVDCGLKFPDETMLGIDFVIPDIQYLRDNKEHLKGIFITHGHEDHIGALPFVLPQLDAPVYCTPLVAGLIQNKMEEVDYSYKPKYNLIGRNTKIDVAPFSVEFISVCHSIPDALALAIHTPMGIIVHTGDFKLDSTPVDGIRTDFSKFAQLGKDGVLLLMSDSTNIERDGVTPSESIVGQTFERLFRLYKDRRIVIAAFSSNLHRTQQVLNVAARFNRKVALVGRSMQSNVALAVELGYVNLPSDDILISPEEASSIPDNRCVILTTGSQGEPFSGLVMMSRGMHRSVRLGPKDLVIISASPIPGNEKLVSQTIDRLLECGCEVIYGRDEKTHSSGHASKDELTLLISVVNPTYFMPVHGEYRHLVRHAQLAKNIGIASKNVFILQNGDVLKFKSPKKASIDGSVNSGAILVDGLALGESDSGLLRQRRELSENGIVIVSVVLNSNGMLAAPLQIQTKGSVVTASEDNKALERAVNAALEQFKRTPGAKTDTLPTEIRKRIRSLFGKTPKSYPTIVPLISRLSK